MDVKKKTGAIVLAGGRGKRMNSSVQKQYLMLEQKPLIAYSLEAFEESNVEKIVLVVAAGEVEYARQQILASLCLKKLKAVTEGGKERYHSVYEGLKCLEDCDYVLIHDGARPLVTADMINGAIAGAQQYGACVVGMPVKDTIKLVDQAGFAAETPDRTYLWQIQTPQAFSYSLIRQAYDRLMSDVSLQEGITDDAMVVESNTSHRVKLIEGSYENLKVTTPEDLILAQALLQNKSKKC